ncbi:MAG: tRNA uridine-5-carboxymethylaminomethyl(34) synthesis GTPase MnmE [Clostridia bacterium]|nr:tRNA uridine-5-carboxymethylaminomethyl(34) synthesis GTPase MnmE [Clostridia bacterium]MDQ7792225.1 tRNA uridine-5-carboxymethylaminomethyl(34) synthesis GTPase MnmE [Clostridia bacterium]
MLGDTIAALATPLGEGGVGIVRLSGPAALEVAAGLFKAKHAQDLRAGRNYHLVYGHIVDPETGDTVDEVLLAVMRAPHSYTREDVVEVHAHGGIVPLRRILELCIAGGARLAEAGEFTKRAFLNGRLDLAQAEAVLDVIRSKTGDGLRLAVDQLGGRLSRKIASFREDLVQMLAEIEASIDFPEEEIPESTMLEINGRLRRLAEASGELLAGAEAGRIYREGLATVIVGKPNVGKSSLLNALLRENRAIVTEIPGTTRDVIEEIVNIRGIPIRLLDTAGLRETEDIIEQIGVERSRQAVALADLVILVLDADTGIEDEDRRVVELVAGKQVLAVVNKTDLAPEDLDKAQVKEFTGAEAVVRTAVTDNQGLEALESAIADLVLGGRVSRGDTLLITNGRHKAALIKARKHLLEASDTLRQELPLEMTAIDIRSALEAFGEITGSTVTEDILDRIFADFCIGK